MNDCNLYKIKQKFNNDPLIDIQGALREELKKIQPFIKPGANIALAVGSRGIKKLAEVVAEVASFVKDHYAKPFIIPAMGSHGGATSSGQAEVLSGYGISEQKLGIPVRSSMEVLELPRGNSSVPVYMDKNAWDSDGVILINRIKPHTDYHGHFESGLVKMSVIGLGKEKQASAVHSYGVYGLSDLIPMIAKEIFRSGKLIGGIGLVENKYDDLEIIKVLITGEIFEKEPELLEIARNNMPSLPVNDIDILIVDQMGKDISGVGIDTNIIGRIKISGQKEPESPAIKAIAVLDLTENSHGNAIGVGLSDVITRKLFEKIDLSTTYTNAVTSSFLERAKIPVIASSDREAFGLALRSCGFLKKGEARIIRIKDTLHLDEMYVSQSVMDQLKDSPDIEILKVKANVFNSNDEISPF